MQRKRLSKFDLEKAFQTIKKSQATGGCTNQNVKDIFAGECVDKSRANLLKDAHIDSLRKFTSFEDYLFSKKSTTAISAVSAYELERRECENQRNVLYESLLADASSLIERGRALELMDFIFEDSDIAEAKIVYELSKTCMDNLHPFGGTGFSNVRVVDSTIALSGRRDEIAGALIEQDFCSSHFIESHPPAALYPDASARKMNSAHDNKRKDASKIVYINQTLRKRAKRMLISGGRFCEALNEKNMRLRKDAQVEREISFEDKLQIESLKGELELNIANAERVLNEIRRLEPQPAAPRFLSLCSNPCGGGYVAADPPNFINSYLHRLHKAANPSFVPSKISKKPYKEIKPAPLAVNSGDSA